MAARSFRANVLALGRNLGLRPKLSQVGLRGQGRGGFVAGVFVRGRIGGMMLFSKTGRLVLDGGMCGFIGATLLFYLLTGSNLSLVIGFIVGVPLGMIAGGILAAVRARK